MKKSLFFIILFLFSVIVLSQTASFKNFKKLSNPKKWWVVLHPFKARVSLKISIEANKVSDSIRKTVTLDGDKAGGQVDAFRHAFWMATLSQEIGKSASRSLGKAHENENYQYFKDNKLEDGIVPDKPSMDMDLHNNEVGLYLVNKGEEISNKEIILRVIKAINDGKMKIIKKNKKNQFLTCKGNIISNKSLKGKWINDKCLVPSNQIAI